VDAALFAFKSPLSKGAIFAKDDVVLFNGSNNEEGTDATLTEGYPISY
jgi:hypothetical protein